LNLLKCHVKKIQFFKQLAFQGTLLTLFQSTTSGVDWRDCYLPLEQSSLPWNDWYSTGIGLTFRLRYFPDPPKPHLLP
jgi:hypothetical protein